MIVLPNVITTSGYAIHEIVRYHDESFRGLLDRYAAKIGQSIPTEEEAQLIFVKDALTDYLNKSDSNLFIKDNAVFRTTEVFNWDIICKITDMLVKDFRSVFNESLKISQKLNRELFNTDSVCSAFALGMLSLEELFVKICENCEYDFEFSMRRLTKEGLAVSLIGQITYGFSLFSEYLGANGKYVTPENVKQIEKIVADVMIADSYRLNTYILK